MHAGEPHRKQGIELLCICSSIHMSISVVGLYLHCACVAVVRWINNQWISSVVNKMVSSSLRCFSSTSPWQYTVSFHDITDTSEGTWQITSTLSTQLSVKEFNRALEKLDKHGFMKWDLILAETLHCSACLGLKKKAEWYEVETKHTAQRSRLSAENFKL